MKDRITIRFPKGQISFIGELRKMAESENKSLNRFLLENIIATLKCCFIVCDKCEWPIWDERKLPFTEGTVTLRCPKCGYGQRIVRL